MPQRIAELVIVRTSEGCLSYRLTAQGRVVWSNRVYDRPEGHQGAHRRLEAWAQRNGYRIVDARQQQRA
jgi:hypothetical protein